MVDKNTVRGYLADVKGALKSAKSYRRSMILNLEADIQEFLSENPDATEADFLTHFGSPGDYAAEYAATLSPSEQKARLSAKKYVTTTVVAGILTALLIWGVGMGMMVSSDFSEKNGYHQLQDS